MRRFRVLVVEDDKDAADSLAMLIRLAGHEVDVAYSPHVALDMAEQQRPDVVLLDIGLPRLDGYEVARTLRKRPQSQHALIVAVTGFGQESAREASAEAGCDLHLVKPIEVQQLIRTISDHPRLAPLVFGRREELDVAVAFDKVPLGAPPVPPGFKKNSTVPPAGGKGSSSLLS